jgi:methionyl aminopeptidase
LVHGIPSERVLKEGDIISIDIGAEYMGFHADSAWTYPVGEISENAKELLRVTEESLYKGLAEAMPDNRLSDISHAIGEYIVQNNYSVVREYVGHGIGEKLHEDPHIPNYGPPHRGPRLKVGMALAIEPMVIEGERYVRVLDDDWTVVSLDKSLCAHYEHTIVITNNGYEIMTKL